MHNVYFLFAAQCRLDPAHTALVTDGRDISYQELSRMINRLASALYDVGIQKGSRVGYMLPNGEVAVELFYACQKLGAVAIPFNYRLQSQDLNQYVASVSCDVFFYDQSFGDLVDVVCSAFRCRYPLIQVGGQSYPGRIAYQEFISGGDEQWAYRAPVSDQDEALYIPTSGSTGTQKAVVHSQESLLLHNLLTYMTNIRYCKSDVFVNYTPLFNKGGINFMTCTLSAGGTFVLLSKYDTEEFLSLIESRRATMISLIPSSIIFRLKDSPHLSEMDFSSVRHVQLGASVLTPAIFQHVVEIFPNAQYSNGFGMSEGVIALGMTFTRDILDDHPELLGSIGKPNLLCEVKLVGKDGREVPRGDAGEAWGRSPVQMKGYLGAPDPSVDGWYPTGDGLRENEDGYYFFVDRKKDVIKSGGQNVCSSEVESVIGSHPAVQVCAVFGTPDEVFSEAVTAAIVVKDGFVVGEDEIQEYCKARIASYKKPRRVIFYQGDLPRNAMHKVDKIVLRAQAIEYMQESAKKERVRCSSCESLDAGEG